ncbi:hypothetical protein P8A22_06675 [Streptomyces laculatispora]|uniref:Secreted protein n=1 Tax=Streptomyces laculatispora TaxID=887464 RepID=A0ABY9HYP5_9ACTN|nr:hypothetical protein [Streptomyces laculatispora]WLQ39713.1 hypothetical protein P8A22_06675 [Streptomyces laculatispora]
MRTRRRIASVLTAVAAVAALGVPTADAAVTDNATLTIYRQGSLTSGEKSVISSALTGYYGPTDLAVSIKSSGTYTGSSETDIVYQAGALPATTIGRTWCDDAVTARKCDQHYVRFNDNTSSIGAINKSNACHESRRAVGLTHGPQASPKLGLYDNRLGCMSYDDVYGLGSNNIQNINATYQVQPGAVP